MPSRTVLAFVLVVALAGCFGSGPTNPAGVPDNASEGEVSTIGNTAGDAETPDPTTERRNPSTEPGDPQSGRGDPITTSEAGTPEDVRYFPSNGTIRYVAAWRHNHDAVERGEPPEREPVYEYVTVEHWVGFHGPSVGAGAVGEAVNRRLDVRKPGVSVGVTAEEGRSRIVARRTTILDRDDTVVSASNVSVERLAAVTPRNVTVTITLADREVTRSYAVQVENATLRQQ